MLKHMVHVMAKLDWYFPADEFDMYTEVRKVVSGLSGDVEVKVEGYDEGESDDK